MDADHKPHVPQGLLDDSIEIPGGVREHRIKPYTNHAGEVAGWFILHRTEAGDWCAGTVNIDPNNAQAVWHLVQRSPLTLDPSILCRGCGDHGYIREGVWVDA